MLLSRCVSHKCVRCTYVRTYGTDHCNEWKRNRLRATAHICWWFLFVWILANLLLNKFLCTRHTFFVWQPHFFPPLCFVFFFLFLFLHYFASRNVSGCTFCSFFYHFISSNAYCNYVFFFLNDFNSLSVPVFYLWVPFFYHPNYQLQTD